MKKIFCGLVFVLVCGCSGLSKQPDVSYGEISDLDKINRISVIKFSDAPNAESGYSGHVVAGAFATELLKVKRISVVEREEMDKILNEQWLSSAGFTDEKYAVELGRLAGADAIIVGSVSEYGTSTIPIFLGLVTYYKDKYNVSANFRLIDCETSKLLFSGGGTASSYDGFEDASGLVAKSLVDKIKAFF